jgi:hypothetical protein
MSLTFHQTFALDCENLAKIISIVAENPTLTNVEIAERTGIGIGKNERQGKVQPMIDYSVFTGLISSTSVNGKRRLALTDVGSIVLEADKWLKKPATQWVLHYHLSRTGSEAEAWTFFVHEFLPANGEFDRRTLELALERRFPSVKIKSINPGVLLTTYTDNNALGRIRLVEEEPRRRYIRGQTYFPNIYTVAYILTELWDANSSGRLMVDPAIFLEPGHLATTMNLSGSEIQQSLNEMTALGIVGQMRETTPYQVLHRKADKLELLRKSIRED